LTIRSATLLQCQESEDRKSAEGATTLWVVEVTVRGRGWRAQRWI